MEYESRTQKKEKGLLLQEKDCRKYGAFDSGMSLLLKNILHSISLASLAVTVFNRIEKREPCALCVCVCVGRVGVREVSSTMIFFVVHVVNSGESDRLFLTFFFFFASLA